MFIIVRKSDNMIIGSAVNPINKTVANKNNYQIFEIDNKDYNQEMIGNILEKYEEN